MFRLALAQINTTVGDIAGNAALVREWTARAAAGGADLVAFPEMTLTGYPAEDLVYRHAFVAASRAALTDLAKQSGDCAAIVGYLDADDDGRRNAAAVLRHGAVCATYAKHHLPNYGVFDERRYFAPGTGSAVVTVGDMAVGVVICEDLWEDHGPVTAAVAAGAQAIVVINGSPYELGKSAFRRELVARRATEAGCPIAYVNLVGGQDELVFDGESFVVAADGRLLARAPAFDEHLLVVDVPSGTASITDDLSDDEAVWRAVVLGTRDYVRKNGFTSVVIGLSGGIDSAVVATIAVDALGADNVHTVGLPSAYSSQHSLDDAADLAERQRTHHRVVPIKDAIDAYDHMTGGLSGIAAENLQARVRGTLLMALSNAEGHLLLTTGNKSELATGFSTLYGDSAGGFAPIKDVPKTMVWALARWRNAQARARDEREPIPASSIAKAPSAELHPGQLDADRLPPYELLDPVLDGYVEDDLDHDALIAAGHNPEVVDRVIALVDSAEYKRRQYPPGPKITPKNFGRDRRLPITSKWTPH